MSEVALGDRQYNSPDDFTDEEAIALSGVLDIHPELNNVDENISLTVQRKTHSIVVSITSIYLKVLQVIIYPSRKSIYNECFVSTGVKSGLSELWVKSQVYYASLFPFQILEGSAHRHDAHVSIRWNGYYVWPRLGYLMEQNEHNLFITRIRRDGREEIDILDLISTDNGLIYWKDKGYSWEMEFDLNVDSTSRRILSAYQRPKNH